MMTRQATGEEGKAKAIRVLLVEDSPLDAELVVRVLQRGGYSPQWRRVETEAEMRAALDAASWDMVISDFSLPGFDGIVALRALQEAGLDIPFIMVSGAIGEETAVAAMKEGAHDYVMKDNLARLAPAVERELKEAEVRRERRKLAEAIETAARQWRSTIDAMNDAVFLSELDGRIQRCNLAFCNLVGKTFPEILGRPYWEIVYGTPGPIEGCLSEAVKRSGRRENVALSLHDRCFHVVANPMLDRTGELTGIVHTLTDITERKQAEDELRQTRNYLDNILNAMPSILVGVDAGGRVTHWTKRARQATGATLDQVHGRRLEEVLPQLAPYLDKVQEAMHARQPRVIEKVETHSDGERHYADVLVFPLAADGVEGAVIRVDDITERVRVQALMVQTEKMLMVGGLAAGMAHEINNPLGAITQAAQNIERRLSPDLPANAAAAAAMGVSLDLIRGYLDKRGIQAFVADIREAGGRAARIVSNMLQFSRRSESKSVPTELPGLLDHAVELADNDYDLKKTYDFRHIEIVSDYDPSLPPVPLIATEIEQVILNLLKNAAHAMVGRTSPEPPRITLSSRREGESAVIQVTDNGCGMDERVQQHVFEPFFTTKEVGVGTGLGLSVSYMIITNNHKGTIEVDSAPERGTTFSIRLPLEKMP